VVSVVLLVTAVVYYVAKLRPEQSRLSVLEAQYQQQKAEITSSASNAAKDPEQSPAERARIAVESLDNFKSGYLTPYASGRIALINELNALAKKYNLQLPSGIDMSTEASDEGSEGGSKAGGKQEDLNRVFPRLFVRTSVFGQYKDLRGFVAEVERNKQFLVLQNMSLINQTAKTSTGGTGRASRMQESTGIALTIEIWAYFRPAGHA
jgi:Tfp pilus assembly protein PilO